MRFPGAYLYKSISLQDLKPDGNPKVGVKDAGVAIQRHSFIAGDSMDPTLSLCCRIISSDSQISSAVSHTILKDSPTLKSISGVQRRFGEGG